MRLFKGCVFISSILLSGFVQAHATCATKPQCCSDPLSGCTPAESYVRYSVGDDLPRGYGTEGLGRGKPLDPNNSFYQLRRFMGRHD